MVHRILIGGESAGEGQGAKNMALDLLGKSLITAAWDLSPGGFYNCVRVLSVPKINTPSEQATFDKMLDDRAASFGVVRRADVGAYLGVVGTPIEA